jgi:imidazolonepropionase-like amidohydrolase
MCFPGAAASAARRHALQVSRCALRWVITPEWRRDLGSLEVGKPADLVALDVNPLADLRKSESVELGMVNGRLFNAATLRELGGSQRERWAAPTMFWNR